MPGQHKFPRRERLTRKREFQNIYQLGEKRVGPAFVCYAVRRESQGRKFGCAVSRKIGNAVARNRVKRYLREVYRRHRDQLVDDVHLILVARPVSARMSYRECRDAIRRLLHEGDVVSG